MVPEPLLILNEIVIFEPGFQISRQCTAVCILTSGMICTVLCTKQQIANSLRTTILCIVLQHSAYVKNQACGQASQNLVLQYLVIFSLAPKW